MNKKGFTLIEVIATITILSLLVIIVSTNGFGTFDNTRSKIEEQDRKSIIEAGEILFLEIKSCDETLNMEDLLDDDFNGDGKKNCDDLISQATTEDGLDVKLKYLIDNKYISGNNITSIDKENLILNLKINGNLHDIEIKEA